MDVEASLQGQARGGPPLIGVTPSLDARGRLRPGTQYWYLSRRYTRALAEAGAAPVVLTPDTPLEACLRCDGLVLSGGDDLPRRFDDATFASGAWRGGVPGRPESAERIAWERQLLEAFAAQGKPVLGVCFGMQLMNLHFGGTLRVDLAHAQKFLDHGGGGRSTRHSLRVSSSSPFLSGFDATTLVSSSHRQGIEGLAPGFAASAWAEDGLVEAIERENLIGVEWHPEADASAAFIYSRFGQLVLLRRPRATAR